MKELIPQTQPELADMIASATEPLHVRGAGTRTDQAPADGSVLRTTGLTGIEIYEPGALTLVAKAGTPLADVEAALTSENQRLAFEPMDHRALLGTSGEPTVGGMVAANVSGPRRIQVGACRDSLLGVKFVDGQGQALSNGGRVMKNVTGYDLVKLMAGSFGTLGVLSEVALKVLPQTETEATLCLHNLDHARAVAAMSSALGSPYEVTGAAHAHIAGHGTPQTLLRIEGTDASVRYRLEALRSRLADFGELTDIHGSASRKAWEGIRDASSMADRAGDIWRVSVKPSDAPTLIESLGADAQTQLDWGGGLIWALMPEGTDLRAQLGAFAGHATLIRGSQATRATVPMFHPHPESLARLSRGLKDKFDPRRILNPNLMELGG